MTLILKIRAVGEPVLRGRARPLQPEEILLPSTQELIAAMRETMTMRRESAWPRRR